MGEVWRAKDLKLDREVAIKVLPARLSSSTAWKGIRRSGSILRGISPSTSGTSRGFRPRASAGHRDTASTRRPVAGFSLEYVTESLGLSPDGSRLTISTGEEFATIMLAEGVPGALPPVRK